MGRFLRHEQCPRCARNGRDRHGNNLGVYADGGTYCFSCGFGSGPSIRAVLAKEQPIHDKEKAVLPSDFTREVPPAAWKWLLQYGIPLTYWKTHCGYSEKESRLVFPIGEPTKFSCGRYVGSEPVGKSKWKVYGDKSSHIEIISKQLSTDVVLVEDIISAHKVGFVATAIPLFGTAIGERLLKVLIELDRPVCLWLDADQYGQLNRKLGKLMAFTKHRVKVIRTNKDPKECTFEEIRKEVL
jgi:hypothetical protein